MPSYWRHIRILLVYVLNKDFDSQVALSKEIPHLRFHHPTRLDTLCAHPESFYSCRCLYPYLLKIRQPNSLCPVICMAYVVPNKNSLATYCTPSSHYLYLLSLGWVLVPKPGLEPGRELPTTPSRWRVYQIPPLRHYSLLITIKRMHVNIELAHLLASALLIQPCIGGDGRWVPGRGESAKGR